MKQAIDSDVAAGKILTGTSHFDPRAKIDQIRIAFDGDAVLFASESERIYQHEGMQALWKTKGAKADIPLQKGPFANFLLTIAHIQELFQDKGNSPLGLRWLLHEMPQHMNGQSKPCENGMSILMRRFSLGE